MTFVFLPAQTYTIILNIFFMEEEALGGKMSRVPGSHNAGLS